MDVLTKEQRSYNMSRIRGKWTSPEKKFHSMLKGKRIKHKMHPKMTGSPDILFPESKTVLFIHGCFWHKCPKHYVKPKTMEKFWANKIENNVKRDKIVVKKLRSEGWHVIRVWEHDIRNDKGLAIENIIKGFNSQI